MPRPKKNATAASTVQHRRPRTTDPDARIALVDKQIQRLETLNANRRELIAKTEEKLNQRKDALCKSEAMLENARAKRERIVAFKERSSMTKAEKAAMRAEERAKMTALMDALKKKGISLDDIIQELDKSED